ncbi:MAG: restriction endonuclease subunit S [Oribacterium sp.]|nr:restriction endonuclease subunit S [Oribacterium sp.]
MKTGNKVKEIDPDEYPFDIPESWKWVRMGEIGDTNIGLTYKPADKSDKGVIVLRSSNIQNGHMDYADIVKVQCEIPERAMISKGDLLICARNGSRSLVGKAAVVDQDGMAFGAFMAKFNSPINPYIYYFLQSPIFRGQLDGVKTETINQITQDMLKNQVMPLPPIEEQHRIVAKIEELLPYVDRYAEAYEKLEQFNAKFPEDMKKSILQYAIQGKLVEQRPEEGTAEELYQQIQKEKQKLIKEGKIKKEKPLAEITEDEIPFDIPESWKWVRLSEVIDVRDGTHDSPKYVPEGIPLVTSKNLSNGTIDYGNVKYITQSDADKINERSAVSDADILFAMIGSIGNPVLVKKDREFCIKNMALFKRYADTNIDMNYMYWFFYFVQYSLKAEASGGVQSFISLTRFREYPFPLPPYEE